MPYSPTSWVNGSTKLNATNMNNLEAGTVASPYGPDAAANQVPVWNGSAWVYQGIRNAQVDPAAAIAYSKLALAGSIVNADIAAAAAIAASKLAGYPTDATRALFGDGSWKVPAVGSTHIGEIAGTTAVTSVANQANLTPILPTPEAVFSFTRAMVNVSVQSGNYDIGVYYSDDEATFTRLWSKGTTAMPVAGDLTITGIATQTIAPVPGRRWYFAWAIDNVTGKFSGIGTQLAALGFIKATSYPLPATLTAMSANALNISWILAV